MRFRADQGRTPVALANWKMAMSLAETQRFVARFVPLVRDLTPYIDIIVCPPCTALHTLATLLRDTGIMVGAQHIYPATDPAYTGEVSAALVADAGAQWVLVGHWERRRHFGETNDLLQQQIQHALQAGLRPVVLLGEPRTISPPDATALLAQAEQVLAGCTPEAIARMVFVYEPEETIGRAHPLEPARVGQGCHFLRTWLMERFGPVAARARIIYGGSVTPETADQLLTHPDVDGLGAGRRGRDPLAFAAIVHRVVQRRAATADG